MQELISWGKLVGQVPAPTPKGACDTGPARCRPARGATQSCRAPCRDRSWFIRNAARRLDMNVRILLPE